MAVLICHVLTSIYIHKVILFELIHYNIDGILCYAVRLWRTIESLLLEGSLSFPK